jgi:hypothetical protein
MQHFHDIKNLANLPGHIMVEDHKKDVGGIFSSMSSGLLFTVIVVSYTAVIFAGVYLGRYRFLKGIAEPEAPIETAVAAVLGLLAFVLGFTFSVTWSWFGNRNNLVMQHAKAITLCYLRASLLPEKQKSEVRKLLYEYNLILLNIQKTPDLESVVPRIEQIHLHIWQQAVSLAKEDIDSELRSLFIGSVNDLVSLALERKTVALFIRIPDAIWRSLLLLALIAMLAFGYQAGISGTVKFFQMPLLPIAFGLVILLIADLNSQETQRQFKVNKWPLAEVLAMMKKDIP